MKKKNPAAGRIRSEVGIAAAWMPHPDLTPVRPDLKPGDRYLRHTTFDGFEFEAPPTDRWRRQSTTTEIVAVRRRYVDERTWTYNRLYFTDSGKAIREPVRPRGRGWELEVQIEPHSCSWRRRREVSR